MLMYSYRQFVAETHLDIHFYSPVKKVMKEIFNGSRIILPGQLPSGQLPPS